MPNSSSESSERGQSIKSTKKNQTNRAGGVGAVTYMCFTRKEPHALNYNNLEGERKASKEKNKNHKN